MKRKYLSIVLAALIVASSLPIGTAAASIEEEPSSAEKGTFFFDGGEGWEDKNVCFYVWDDTTHEHAQKDGWAESDNWGASKKIGGTKLGGSLYESYEIDLTGREDHAIFAIFHCRDTGAQTMNCIINSSVFGTTATRTGVMYENPVDSEKLAEGVKFDGGTGVGIEKLVTSSGKIQGDVIAPGKTPDGIVAQFVLDCFGEVEKVSGKPIVTNESVADAIAAFGTTKDAVWAKYQTFSGNEKYNAAAAEDLIYGRYSEPIVSKKLLGDVDGDGKITSGDSLYILRRSVGLEAANADVDKLADVNSDGSIKSDDSLEVLRASVNIPSPYPIGEAIA